MKVLHDVFQRLLEAYGPQQWWPGDSPLEVMVGAVLTQNTSWKNVERAIANLKQARALTLDTLHAMSHEELAELIRPAGYYQLKAKRLKNLLALIADRFDGEVDELLSLNRTQLRDALLSVNGIGPETADSMVLYAAHQPIFVVDTYTSRVLKRHGWIQFDADYREIQELFHMGLAEDTELFNEYHALLVRVGNQHCRKTPKCDACPLRAMLPDGGPLEE